jgi:xanthine dehydrogenase YagR molybdenum-binding subunit
MTEIIGLTRDPAHIRHGSNIGQPLTRRDGILKVKGEARYAADNHPPGMLYAVVATSCIARPRHASRRRGGQGASGRRRCDDADA